ncbi:MAG: GGDEF domain-containing protein [Bdellovibrionales bacterium]
MRHEDFTSIEVEPVLEQVLQFCIKETHSKSVHWLSAFGLARVQESSNETWHWTFSTADVVGKHVVSRPQVDLFDMFHVWRKVGALYPAGMKGAFTPHTISAAPNSYFAQPVSFNGVMQGILLFEGGNEKNPVALFNKLRPSLDIAAKYIAFSYQQLDAKNMSYVDEVTGLYNQRYLPMVLEHEIHRNKREGSQFSLLFLDIDYFKMVNDGRGHWVGSRLLLELGKILKSQVRSCDYLFRYGGDEFIVLLGNSNSQTSKIVAERIRKAIESHTFSVEGHNLNLTVSIGLAAYPEHAQTASGLIQIADQAMYYGKRKSRNIVFVAS